MSYSFLHLARMSLQQTREVWYSILNEYDEEVDCIGIRNIWVPGESLISELFHSIRHRLDGVGLGIRWTRFNIYENMSSCPLDPSCAIEAIKTSEEFPIIIKLYYHVIDPTEDISHLKYVSINKLEASELMNRIARNFVRAYDFDYDKDFGPNMGDIFRAIEGMGWKFKIRQSDKWSIEHRYLLECKPSVGSQFMKSKMPDAFDQYTWDFLREIFFFVIGKRMITESEFERLNRVSTMNLISR